MIHIGHKGSFSILENFLTRYPKVDYMSVLHRYGAMGVNALGHMTPKGTGLTAQSWGYTVTEDRRGATLSWYNTNETSQGTPIVVLLYYGHGTRGGGYVEGRDFINPAIRPIFDLIAEELWREVTK